MENITEFISPVLLILFGGLASFVATVAFEYLRKPVIKARIGKTINIDYSKGNWPAKYASFLALEIYNEALPDWLRWIGRTAGQQCRATIRFRKHGELWEVFPDSPMIGRWRGTPEPIPIEGILLVGNQAHPLHLRDNLRFELLQTVDITTQLPRELDIAAKFDDEKMCYGWSNESYLTINPPNWRNKNRRLDDNRYILDITIDYLGGRERFSFQLNNDDCFQITDFKNESRFCSC